MVLLDECTLCIFIVGKQKRRDRETVNVAAMEAGDERVRRRVNITAELRLEIELSTLSQGKLSMSRAEDVSELRLIKCGDDWMNGRERSWIWSRRSVFTSFGL